MLPVPVAILRTALVKAIEFGVGGLFGEELLRLYHTSGETLHGFHLFYICFVRIACLY